jgi:hypothetical protein
VQGEIKKRESAMVENRQLIFDKFSEECKREGAPVQAQQVRWLAHRAYTPLRRRCSPLQRTWLETAELLLLGATHTPVRFGQLALDDSSIGFSMNILNEAQLKKLLLSPTIPEGVLSSYVSSKTTDKKEFLTATWHPNGGCQLERSQVRHKRVNQRHRERFGACSQLRGLPHASPLRRCSPVGFSGWECNWATL